MQSTQTPTVVASAVASGRAVVPISPVTSRKSRALTGKEIVEAANKEAVTQFARLLHESEAVVVVEYIEAVVPVVYAIYIAVLFHLPNAKYYKDMESFTEEKLQSVVTSILIYAFMELLSLLYTHYILKRHFGISVFYQLASAFESEWPSYQCEFTTWILVVFQFLLVHSGTVASSLNCFYSSFTIGVEDANAVIDLTKWLQAPTSHSSWTGRRTGATALEDWKVSRLVTMKPHGFWASIPTKRKRLIIDAAASTQVRSILCD